MRNCEKGIRHYLCNVLLLNELEAYSLSRLDGGQAVRFPDK